MSLIDFILNLVGLVFWLSWISPDPQERLTGSAATLAGTLKRANTPNPMRGRVYAGLVLPVLLVVRGGVYYLAGRASDWTPVLELGVVTLHFRNGWLSHMLLFSVLSFGLTLVVFYSWLLLLSAVNHNLPDTDAFQAQVRGFLGSLDRWPRVIKLALPFIGCGLLWIAWHPLLVLVKIVPAARSQTMLAGQGAIIGCMSYLGWKYLIVGLLLVHLVNSYVYLGNQPFLGFINGTSRNLLTPVRWLPLRIGKVDFSPLVGIALVFLLSEAAVNLPVAISNPRRNEFDGHLYRLLHPYMPF
jgi:uncharacterized protein YggT (Ycf19 family)